MLYYPRAAFAPPRFPTLLSLPGLVEAWEPQTLGLGHGASVLSWLGSLQGIPLNHVVEAGAIPHTVVRGAYGGLPGVRLSGTAVLATSGNDPVGAAMKTSTWGLIVVAANVVDPIGGPTTLSALASTGGTAAIMEANAAKTGRYTGPSMTASKDLYSCGTAGLRTIGISPGGASGGLLAVNGSLFAAVSAVSSTGPVYVGGWQSKGNGFCSRGDILGVYAFNRVPTAADHMRVMRLFCDRTGEAYPGGLTSNTLCFGVDSLTAGAMAAGALDTTSPTASYPAQLIAAAGRQFGTFHNLAVPGKTFANATTEQLPFLGDISALTKTQTIHALFEFANVRNSATALAGMRTYIAAAKAFGLLNLICMGTSTNDNSTAGAATETSQRQPYNTYLESAPNRAAEGIDLYAPIHLNANVGVPGSAPAVGSGNTYFQNDALHLTLAGYTEVANVFQTALGAAAAG